MTKYIIVTFDEYEALVYETIMHTVKLATGVDEVISCEHNTMFFDSFRVAVHYAQENIKDKRATIVRLNYIGETYGQSNA